MNELYFVRIMQDGEEKDTTEVVLELAARCS